MHTYIPVSKGAASQATGEVAAKGCSLITANNNQRPKSHFVCSSTKAQKRQAEISQPTSGIQHRAWIITCRSEATHAQLPNLRPEYKPTLLESRERIRRTTNITKKCSDSGGTYLKSERRKLSNQRLKTATWGRHSHAKPRYGRAAQDSGRELTMAELQDMPSTESRELTTALRSYVRSEFKKSPLMSNACICLILVCAKMFIGKEFACPCNDYRNVPFVAVYCIVPAVVVFLLMMNITGCQCRMSMEIAKTVASNFVPAMFWIIIVLWDGYSFACTMTTWSGSYIEIDEAAPQKWCKPANLTPSQELDYKTKTQFWFFMSQGIAMVMIALIFIVYLSFNCCCQQKVRDGEVHRSPI
ncbi:uncharacterized protein LOC125887833 [Epinephelus fuscoguttatus]|uniref:uncharacterized protein LOC125887833 n=1 Tax=Epinephelus fuscoguttatus TaxID=293821 RepID=UPI0020D0D6BC|nr:uncharacterized protein LOC125887833 [Epinephelus fuscoguttatus]